jgi:hypothetical protein
MPTPMLINDTSSVDKLLAQADALDIDVRLGDDGKINFHALKKTPETAKWVQQFGKAVQQNKSLVQFALTKKGWPEVFNPSSPLDALIPKTGAGQGAMAALTGIDTVAPEVGIPAQIGLDLLGGTAGGMAGGALNHEDLGSSAVTGAESGVTNLGLKGLFAGAKTAAAWLKQPGRLDKEMMAKVGSVVKQYIEPFLPKTAARIVTDPAEFGKTAKDTVVRILNSPDANFELQKHYQDTLDTVTKGVRDDAVKNAQDLKDRFKATYGFSPTSKPPKGAQATKKMLRDLKEYREAVADARQIGPEMKKAFEDVSAMARGSYDADNELKHSYTAIKGVQNKTQLNDKINQLVAKADPSGQLTQLLAQARDDYAKFSGFQDFVNQDNVMDKQGRWFNAQTLQKSVDGNTNPAVRFIQRRIKEAFEPLYNAVRRDAPSFTPKGNPIVSDTLPLQSGMRAIGKVPGVGSRVSQYIPTPRQFTRFIGDRAPIIQGAGQLPVLLNSPVTRALEPPQDQP